MSKFLRDIKEYVRDINVVQGYMSQTAFLMQRITGVDEETAKNWLAKEFGKGGRFEIKPPTVNVTVRDPETGDRRASTVKMDKLLKVVAGGEFIMSPSMAIYTPPKREKSLLSIFIDANIKKRGKVKDEMFAAQSSGNMVLAANKENEQNSLKQRNNGLSGAHSSPYTILFNKSTHSSLTSTCRSATSYGNANNEKFMGGSRHYWSPGIVVANIASICTLTDKEAFAAVMDKYNLYYPTVDDVMACVRRSSDNYWRNAVGMDRIKVLVERLTDLERAAFVYIGDFYHLAKFNEEFARELITEFYSHDPVPLPVDEATDISKQLDGDTAAYVSLLRSHDLSSSNIKDTKKNNLELWCSLMATAKHVYTTIEKYSFLFRELYTTKNVPASIAKIPDVVRRIGLVSDTDSTMCTAQWWSEWYCGKDNDVGVVADAVADTVTYLAVQNIAHMMARMSANMGVDEEQVFRYAMKNEYKFASFALTSKAKHYFALITSREGTLYSEPELEAKGVALRTSNIPDSIMKHFRETIEDMSHRVANGKKIKLMPLLREIASIEVSIVESVKLGEYTYLKTGQIRTKEGYANPESSNYLHHELWEEVWAPKYGRAGEPPYGVIQVHVDLPNKTAIKRWVAGMEDRALASRMEAWLSRTGRKDFTRFLLPEVILTATGIPKEILDIVDYRRIIFTSVEPYYHVLESLGVTAIDDNRTLLMSDYYA